MVPTEQHAVFALQPLVVAFLLAACSCCGGSQSEAVEAKPGAAPAIHAGGIAAVHSEWQGITPGAITVLYGQDLGPAEPCEAKGGEENYPTELCETRVLVEGLEAGLLYAAAGQINFQIPEAVEPSDAALVQVVRQGRESPPQKIAIISRKVLPDGDAPALAATLIEVAETAPWGETIEAWRKAHPSARCERFQGTSGTQFAPDSWCYRCETTQGEVTAEWSFYAWPSQEPPACRLNQLHAWAEGLSDKSLEETHQRVTERLTQGWGEPGTLAVDFHAGGSAYWFSKRYWKTPAGFALLYRAKPPRLALLARSQPLLDAEQRQKSAWKEGPGDPQQAGREIAVRLGADLEEEYPGITVLLTGSPREGDLSRKRETVLELLLRLVGEAEKGSRERQAARLLAGDRLADLLANLSEDERNPGQPWPGFEAQRERLAARGVDFEWAHFGAVFGNTGNLRQRVWRDYADTVWWEYAFVSLMARGWDTSMACPSGEAYFRLPIERGEAFLADRPRSPFRREVIWNLAQAQETWWSLSQASAQDVYVDTKAYQEGSEAARKKAIGNYRRLLADNADDPYARDANMRLPRLELGYDTNQRRYFHICD